MCAMSQHATTADLANAQWRERLASEAHAQLQNEIHNLKFVAAPGPNVRPPTDLGLVTIADVQPRVDPDWSKAGPRASTIELL